MKSFFKIFVFLMLLVSLKTFAQGSVTTPFDTTGWSAPEEYTTNYGLRIFRLLSNPGGGYNKNTKEIDSLLNALVVYVDSLQLVISNDTLKFSPYSSGQAAFTTTDQYDTVVVSGVDSLDEVFVNVREQVPGANDILGVIVKQDTIICTRPASGTSGLKWNWYWKRRYQ